MVQLTSGRGPVNWPPGLRGSDSRFDRPLYSASRRVAGVTRIMFGPDTSLGDFLAGKASDRHRSLTRGLSSCAGPNPSQGLRARAGVFLSVTRLVSRYPRPQELRRFSGLARAVECARYDVGLPPPASHGDYHVPGDHAGGN